MRRMLLAIVCALALCTAALAAQGTADSMSVRCTVDENGTAQVDVTAHLTLDGNVDSLTVGLGPNVSGARAEGYNAKVHRKNGNTQLVISSDTGLPASMDLTLHYAVHNTVTAASGGQNFAIRLLGGLDADISACTLQITMPKAFDSNPDFSSSYYADGIDNYMDISIADGVISAALTQPLLAGETLDLKLTLDDGYFTLHNVPGRTLKLDRILLLVLLALGALYWLRFLRGHLPRVQRRALAPAGVGPGEVGTLLTGQAPDLALMAANWAASGYLRITRARHGQVWLEQLMPMGNERSPYEAALFRQLFARNSTAAAETLRHLQPQANQAVHQYWDRRMYHRRSGNPRIVRALGVLAGAVCGLYFADSVVPSMSLLYLPLAAICLLGGVVAAGLQYGLLGIFRRRKRRPALALAACVLALLLAGQLCGCMGVLLLLLLIQLLVAAGTNFGPRRSENGQAVQNQLLGYRAYLRGIRPEEAETLLAQDPMFFYKALPYAMALDLGGRFAAAFDGCRLEPCDFYVTQSKGAPRTGLEFYASFRRALDVLRGERHRSLRRRLHRRKRTAPPQARRAPEPPERRRKPQPTGSARPHRRQDYDGEL